MEEPAGVQFGLELFVEANEQFLRGGRIPFAELRRYARLEGRPPLVGVDGHSLSEVQGMKLRVDGNGDDTVGQRYVASLQAGALAAEQQTDTPAPVDPLAQPPGALARRQDRQLGLAWACGG